jgi:hypothetical protein
MTFRRQITTITLLLFFLTGMAQQPFRSYSFQAYKNGFFSGAQAVSANGELMLATFNNLDKKVQYELVNLHNGNLIANGSLGAVPYRITWSCNNKQVLIEYIRQNPECYSVSGGLKRMCVFGRDGTVVFTPTSLLQPAKESEVFLFNESAAFRFNLQGKLLDSTEYDDFLIINEAWHNQLHNEFVALHDDGLDIFSTTGKLLRTVDIPGIGDFSRRITDKDGAALMVYDENNLFVYNVSTGKKNTALTVKDLQAACFTPDRNKFLYKTKNAFYLVNEKGGILATMPCTEYYNSLYYSGFGTELLALQPGKLDMYPCKNYFPEKKETVAIPQPEAIKKTPVTAPKLPPPVAKEAPMPGKKAWKLPYTVEQFITPKARDSFLLLDVNRVTKYYIVYDKRESGILFKNSWTYIQYYGFADQAKYETMNYFLLNFSEGEALAGAYARTSSYQTKEQIMGGGNIFAKIPETEGQTLRWKTKFYTDEYDMRANVMNHPYKGKNGKCLVIGRSGNIGGSPFNEEWYYQLNTGLVKIMVNGKLAYER